MMVGRWKEGSKNETQQTGQATESSSPSCKYRGFNLVYDNGLLVDRERALHRVNVGMFSRWAMTCKECEGDGCTKCTAFCGDCLTPLENCGCKP